MFFDRVMLALLTAGAADPTATKWFSIAYRLRVILFGALAHMLLPRAWRRKFGKTIRKAWELAGTDAAGEQTYESETRGRYF